MISITNLLNSAEIDLYMKIDVDFKFYLSNYHTGLDIFQYFLDFMHSLLPTEVFFKMFIVIRCSY